jgi:peptide/nickel transport system ATP-binding protein
MAVLELKSLEMSYKTQEGNVRAIDGASLRVEKGDTVGIVGESGCGKTSIGLSILRLLPPNATIHGGQILFKGQDLLLLSEKDMRSIRWKNISMIFQAAMNALDPVYRVGDQLIEALVEHQKLTKKQASDKMEAVFQLVGLDPGRARNYPHEYSGGMKQRAIIAMSLICDPDIIIADEATTALDVLVQDRILASIEKIKAELSMTMLYISHDIAVISEVCNKIAVMYAGSIVEHGDTMSLFKAPLHPYTQGLMHSFPKIHGKLERLEGIPGEPPRLTDSSPGCRFFPRCQQSLKECNSIRPEFTEIEKNHWVACHATRRSL